MHGIHLSRGEVEADQQGPGRGISLHFDATASCRARRRCDGPTRHRVSPSADRVGVTAFQRAASSSGSTLTRGARGPLSTKRVHASTRLTTGLRGDCYSDGHSGWSSDRGPWRRQDPSDRFFRPPRCSANEQPTRESATHMPWVTLPRRCCLASSLIKIRPNLS